MAFVGITTTTSTSPHLSLLLLLLLPLSALAQFQFFEQMFNNPSQAQQHAQHAPQQQNVASDSSWYRRNYDGAYCSNYLCPGTLACVHFPHHCPCAWPVKEDKFELGEGSAVCVSKKGWNEEELARRVELARKGWI